MTCAKVLRAFGRWPCATAIGRLEIRFVPLVDAPFQAYGQLVIALQLTQFRFRQQHFVLQSALTGIQDLEASSG